MQERRSECWWGGGGRGGEEVEGDLGDGVPGVHQPLVGAIILVGEELLPAFRQGGSAYSKPVVLRGLDLRI